MTVAAVHEVWEWESEMPPLSGPVRVGLDGDQVWQKFLASRIAREREFSIYQTDGAIDTGFVTGFDEVCVQLSTSESNPRALIIRVSAIAKITETGNRVSDLPHESREKIRGFSYALRQHAMRATGGGPEDGSRPARR